MAKVKTKAKVEKTKEKAALPFTKRNWTWLGIGLLVIVVGYIALARGSITLAPILLVAGYCILIPIAILLGEKKKQDEKAPKPEELVGKKA